MSGPLSAMLAWIRRKWRKSRSFVILTRCCVAQHGIQALKVWHRKQDRRSPRQSP